MKDKNPAREHWLRTSMRGFDPLCTDPRLFKRFINYISRTRRCDEPTKILVFATILSAFTNEPLNTFLKGDSSTGKTFNTIGATEFFSDEIKEKHVWLLGGMSPKALIHSNKSVLKDSNGNIIDISEKPTTRKPRRGRTESEDDFATRIQIWETEKLEWAERIQDAFYEVNLERIILIFLEPPQIETFNHLRPILSHDAKEISFKIAEKTGGGQLKTTHVKIKGWPASIFCTSDEATLKDLSTRSFNITPETTAKKLSSALDVLAEQNTNPWKFEKDEEWVKLESYFRWWIHTVCNYKCLVPYSCELKEVFPLYASRCMRDFKHILTLIKVHALFHLAQRPVINKDNENYVLATFADLKAILDVLPSFEETTVTGLPAHIIECFKKVMVPLTNEETDFTYGQLTDRYNEEFDQKRSSKTMYDWVRMLGEVGWVTTYKSEGDKRKILIKVIKKSENSLFSSLGIVLNSFSENNLQKCLDYAQKYSDKKVSLYEDILDKKEASINEVYTQYFCSEYSLEENNPEMDAKSEEKPKIIPQEQNRKSLTMDEIFQSLTCFDCRKNLNDDTFYTYFGGKPICLSCFRKIESQKKGGSS